MEGCERENSLIIVLISACERTIPPPAKQHGRSESSRKIGAQNQPPPPFSARRRPGAIIESILSFDSHTPYASDAVDTTNRHSDWVLRVFSKLTLQDCRHMVSPRRFLCVDERLTFAERRCSSR